MTRIGSSSLFISAILFIGQIVATTCGYRVNVGSAVTGFCLSILFFLFWFSINSVYGQESSSFGVKVKQGMQDMQDIQDMQNIKDMQEMQDMQDMYSHQNIKGMQAMQEMQDKQDI